MVRIYDAAFASTTGTQHQHLGTFWWVNEAGHTGQWTRDEAYSFVANHARGTVFVAEGNGRVDVLAYYNDAGTRWIQTEANGKPGDNLLTLAERHRKGLPNN